MTVDGPFAAVEGGQADGLSPEVPWHRCGTLMKRTARRSPGTPTLAEALLADLAFGST